jgi:HEAT repeat protein
MRALVWGLLGLVLVGPGELRGQDAETVRRLLAKLEQSTDVSERQEAFRELMKLGPEAKDAVPVLIGALRGASNANVRQIFTNVLAKIGKTAVPDLTKALKDEDRTVRRQAVVALGTIAADATPAIPALGTILRDKDKELRGLAINALVRIDPQAKSAGPLFRQALGDDDPNVRLAALYALEPTARQVEAVVKDVAGALRDSDRNVRLGAISVLGRIGPTAKGAMPALTEALGDPDAAVRITAAEVIVGIDTGKVAAVLPVLTEGLLKDKDEQVRRSAAYVIGQIGSPAKDAVTALNQALKDPSPDVRQAAAAALEKVRKKE